MAIATAFREARLAGRALPAYPGELPSALEPAYTIQEIAIEGFPDTVVGWKVAGIRPDERALLGAERLAGPIFAMNLHRTEPGRVLGAPVFEGGFAALEAEFVIRVSRPMPDGAPKRDDDLLGHIEALHAGIEIAGSPFAGLNDLGARGVVSDFGNNAGLVVGPVIPGWHALPLAALTARTSINGSLAGEGSAANVAGGPLGALRFLADHLAARGRPLRAGDLVSTGMTTGIHHVRPGDRATIAFLGTIVMEIEAVPAVARSPNPNQKPA
jgi:2-keto-4-pentenoate hydratase